MQVTNSANGTPSEAPKAKPLMRELLTVPELFVAVPGAAVAAAAAPNGGSRPVLVLPGFVTGDITTAPLRAFLKALGHRPEGWGLGLNVGVADHIASGVDRLLQEMAHRHGSTIDIVGWSAGGIIGRVLAQHRRELVGQVISLGSPIRMHRTDTNIGLLQEIAGHFFVPTPPRFDFDRIPVPSTTVWTDADGVVPGDVCRQTVRPFAEVVQVRGTHCGLGANPSVLYLVAERLAQRPGEWHPFAPVRHLRWWYPSRDSVPSTAPVHEDDQEDLPDAPAVAV